MSLLEITYAVGVCALFAFAFKGKSKSAPTTNRNPGAKKAVEDKGSKQLGSAAGVSNQKTHLSLASEVTVSFVEAAVVKLSEHLEKVTISDRAYYAENLAMSYIREILPLGPYASFSPKPREYYRDWSRRADLPKELKDIAQSAYSQISAKCAKIKAEAELTRKLKVEAKSSEVVTRVEATQRDKMDKFLEIAYRKVTSLDEYGDENKTAFDEELIRFLKKIGEQEPSIGQELSKFRMKYGPDSLSDWRTPISFQISKLLRREFEEHYARRKQQATHQDFAAVDALSGEDFEAFLMEQFRAVGVEKIYGTPKTGDQGADLIFEHLSRKCVVQAKRYSSTVGNKAVQEVVAALGYYGCDQAWVITNSRFTSSAKRLAEQNRVVLVNGDDLKIFAEIFSRAFEDAA